MHLPTLSINKVVVLLLVGLALGFSLGGCSTKVTRMDSGEVKDLSGAWNDTDSQMVAAEMM